MSEHSTNQTGQEVLWLASCEPPVHFVSFLRSRGLTLCARDQSRPMPAARLTMIEASTSPAARPPSLAGRRLAVMHPDPGSADALAQALRAKGAEVAALSLNPESLHRVEALDPDVVVMETSDFTGSCWEIVRALWQHPRLRFATVLLATPELMGTERVSALDVHDLSFAVAQLADDYERVRQAAQLPETQTLSLATLGPARTLRALLESGSSLRARFLATSYVIEVDIAEKIIVGAASQPNDGSEPLLGVHALAFLMAQHEGSVQVRRVDHPAQTNVMAPLDTALHMAREVSGVSRPSGVRWAPVANNNSVPPAARPSKAPSAPAATRVPARTLIGIPAVKVDASIALDTASDQASSEPRASTPAPLAKPAKPITVMPPAPRISVAPSRLTNASPPAGATSAVFPAVGAARRASVRPVASEPAAASVTPPAASPVVSPPASVAKPAVASVPPAALASVPPPPPTASLPPPSASAQVAAPAPADAAPMFDALPLQGMADALEPSVFEAMPEAPPLLARLRAKIQHVHLKLAAVSLLAVVAFWVCARIFGSLAAPAPTSAAAPAIAVAAAPPPRPAAIPPQAAVPPVTEPETAEPPEGEEVRPSRKASELVSQGHALRRKHLLPTARSRYLDALREYPGYPRALAGLAQLAIETGDHAQALQYARQLVRVRPGQSGYHLLLGDALKASGQASQARSSFETAARLGNREAKRRLK